MRAATIRNYDQFFRSSSVIKDKTTESEQGIKKSFVSWIPLGPNVKIIELMGHLVSDYEEKLGNDFIDCVVHLNSTFVFMA